MPVSQSFGFYNAKDYAYGVALTVRALTVNGTSPAGLTTVQVAFAGSVTPDGANFLPLNINAPLTIGSGTAFETVTPTAVSEFTPGVYGSASFTATFVNAHGANEPIASGTVGLQECINVAAANGGGIVTVDWKWAQMGGTSAMLAAAVLPTNGSVIIQDNRAGSPQFWSNRGTGAVITAPVVPTTTQAKVLATTGGTYTNANFKVQFTYVTADGGETTAGSQLTIAAGAAGTSILGGTGPAAETNAVGYRVYISAGGASTGYLLGVTAADSLSGAAGLVQCGPVLAFLIGTGWQSATPLTSANATVPTVSTAFAPSTAAGSAGGALTFPPFANVGAISAATETSLGLVQLPTAFLNTIGRTLRISGTASITVNSATGTLGININLWSAYGVSAGKITPFTTATPSFATGGTQVVNLQFQALMTTTAVGVTGTVEMHGFMLFNEAGALVALAAVDDIAAASSTVDLTKQDTLEVTITTATIAPTAGTLRQLVVEVLA